MRIGSVVVPGPEVKLANTKSSSESVNASRKPAASAGQISGRVTRRKVAAGVAPRSSAASSSNLSNVDSRACTTTVTKHRPSVVWPTTMVQKPRSRSRPTNSSNSDRPIMTSGMTSGAKSMPAISMRPRKRPNLCRAKAAIVPSRVDRTADTKATRRLTMALAMSASLARSEPYQRVEKPPQTVTNREALKE